MGERTQTRCMRRGLGRARRPARLCSICRRADARLAAASAWAAAQREAALPELYRDIRWVYHNPDKVPTRGRIIWKRLLTRDPDLFLDYLSGAEDLYSQLEEADNKEVIEKRRPLPWWWFKQYGVKVTWDLL